jgi:hypothetical protein
VQTQQLWVSELNSATGRSSYGTSSPALQVQLPEHLVGTCSLGQVVHITGHASCTAGLSSIPCIQVRCCARGAPAPAPAHGRQEQCMNGGLNLPQGVVLPTAGRLLSSGTARDVHSYPCSSNLASVTHGLYRLPWRCAQ